MEGLEDYRTPNSQFFPADTPDDCWARPQGRVAVCDDIVLFAAATTTVSESGEVTEYRRVYAYRNACSETLRIERSQSERGPIIMPDGHEVSGASSKSAEPAMFGPGPDAPAAVARTVEARQHGGAPKRDGSGSSTSGPSSRPNSRGHASGSTRALNARVLQVEPSQPGGASAWKLASSRKQDNVPQIGHLQTLRTSVGSNITLVAGAGTNVITGHESGIVCTWNIKSAEMRHHIHAHSAPATCAIAHEGLLFTAAAGGYRPLRAFNLNTGKPHATYGPTNEEFRERPRKRSAFRRRHRNTEGKTVAPKIDAKARSKSAGDVLVSSKSKSGSSRMADLAASSVVAKDMTRLRVNTTSATSGDNDEGSVFEPGSRGVGVTCMTVHMVHDGDGDGHLFAGYTDGVVRVFDVYTRQVEAEYSYEGTAVATAYDSDGSDSDVERAREYEAKHGRVRTEAAGGAMATVGRHSRAPSRAGSYAVDIEVEETKARDSKAPDPFDDTPRDASTPSGIVASSAPGRSSAAPEGSAIAVAGSSVADGSGPGASSRRSDGSAEADAAAAEARLLALEGDSSPVKSIILYDGGVASPPFICVMYGNGRLKLWDTETQKCMLLLHQASSCKLVFEDALYVGGTDGTVRIVDMNEFKVHQCFQAHNGPVDHLAAFNDVLVTASGTAGANVRAWDVISGMRLDKWGRGPRGVHTIGDVRASDAAAGGLNNGVEHLEQHGEVVFTLSRVGNVLRALGITAGNCAGTFMVKTDPVKRLLLSKDNKTLYSGSHRGVVLAWNIDTGEQLRQYFGLDGPCKDLFERDGALIACNAINCCAWHAETAVRLALDDQPGYELWSMFAATNRIITGGRAFARTRDDNYIRAWDSTTWRLVHTYDVPDAFKLAALDKTLVAACSTFEPGSGAQLKIMDVAKESVRHTIDSLFDPVGALEFGDDGHLYAACIGGIVRVIDVSSGVQMQELRSESTRSVTCLIARPSKGIVYTGSLDSTVRMWELSTARLILQFPLWHCDVVNSMALVLDARGDPLKLASSSTDIVTLDLKALRQYSTPVVHMLGEESKVQRFRAEWGMTGEFAMLAVLLLLDFAQFLGLAFWTSVPWHGSSHGDFGQGIVSFGLLWGDYWVQFVFATVMVGLFAIVMTGQEQVEALIFLNPAQPAFVVLWGFLSVFCRVMARPMAAMVLIGLFNVVDCGQDSAGVWRLDSAPEIVCWKDDHLTQTIIAAIALILYIPLCMRFARAHSRMENIEATWNLLDWSADSVTRPPRQHPLSLTRQAVWHQVLAVLVKAGLVLGIVLQTHRPIVMTLVGLVGTVALAVMSVTQPPFFRRDEWSNRINCALNFGLVWVYVVAVLVCTVWEEDPVAWTALGVGVPAFMVLGAIASHFIPWAERPLMAPGGSSELSQVIVADVEAGTPRALHKPRKFGAGTGPGGIDLSKIAMPGSHPTAAPGTSAGPVVELARQVNVKRHTSGASTNSAGAGLGGAWDTKASAPGRGGNDDDAMRPRALSAVSADDPVSMLAASAEKELRDGSR